MAAVVGASLVLAAPAGARPDFYRPPASFDTTPGIVIRTAPMPLEAGTARGVPSRAKRILYTSTLVDGKPVAVSGYLAEPTIPWKGSGPRPTVVVGSGTVGQGDQCAPSRNTTGPVEVRPEIPSAAQNSTTGTVGALTAEGIRVVVTDYIGLGTPGVHTYANRVETANAMLDAARAAKNLTRSPDSPIGFWGYSQGGGASAAAAELASTYAPELTVKGSVAGAPPADLAKVITRIEGNAISPAIGYAVNGMVDRYPELRSIVKHETNAGGKAALHRFRSQCLPDSVATDGFTFTSRWTRTGEPLSRVIARYPAARKVLADQRIGRLKPNAPVLLMTGVNDDVIPTGQVAQLYRDWKAKGAQVKILRDHTPPVLPRSAAGHVIPGQNLSPEAKAWLLARFRN